MSNTQKLPQQIANLIDLNTNFRNKKCLFIPINNERFSLIKKEDEPYLIYPVAIYNNKRCEISFYENELEFFTFKIKKINYFELREFMLIRNYHPILSKTFQSFMENVLNLKKSDIGVLYDIDYLNKICPLVTHKFIKHMFNHFREVIFDKIIIENNEKNFNFDLQKLFSLLNEDVNFEIQNNSEFNCYTNSVLLGICDLYNVEKEFSNLKSLIHNKVKFEDEQIVLNFY